MMQLGGFLPLSPFDIMKLKKPTKGVRSKKDSLKLLFIFFLISLIKTFHHLWFQEL